MKKLLSLLTAMLIFCMCLPGMAADADEMEEKYAASVKFLREMGIYTNTEATLNDEITRRDFAEMIIRTMGFGDISPQNTKFDDVKSDDVKSGYVGLLSDLGILNGYSDSRYEPNLMITWPQAIKAVVCMLGYGEYATHFGGYPTGYLTVANEKNLLRGLGEIGENSIRIGAFCYLITNALETEIMEAETIGSEGTNEYTVQAGRTLLTERHHLYTVTATIEGTHLTTVAGVSTLAENQILVNGQILDTTLQNPEKLLGKYLTLYVQKETDTVVAVQEKRGKNIELILEVSDIEAKEKTQISYTDKAGKTKKALIEKEAVMIYNGAQVPTWTVSLIPEDKGFIRLLDADGDGMNEMVFVFDYVNLPVRAVNTETGTIYFDTQKAELASVTLVDTAKTISVTDAEGNIKTVSEIQKGDIISIGKSKTPEVMILKYSNLSVSGTVNEISNDMVIIGETEYTFDTKMENNLPLLSGTGTFYTDFSGRIAKITYGSADGIYAYLINMIRSKGISPKVDTLLFEADGSMHTRTLAKKVSVNSETAVSALLIPSHEMLTFMGTIKPQLVKIKINAAEEICEIYTALDGSTMSEADRERNFTRDDAFDAVYYRGGNMKLFASRYLVDANTKIFIIPDDLNDKEMFGIHTMTSLVTSTRYSNVEIYDVTEEDVVSIVVMKGLDSFYVYDAASAALVERVSTVIDESGEILTELTVWYDGKQIELLPANGNVQAAFGAFAIADKTKLSEAFKGADGAAKAYIPLDKLSPGDIIQYSRNAEGRISNLRVLLQGTAKTDGENMGSGTPTKDNVYAAVYFASGTVDKRLAAGFRISVPGDGTERYKRVFPFFNGTICLRYIKATGAVEPITTADINLYDDVFVYANSSNVRLVVVYK